MQYIYVCIYIISCNYIILADYIINNLASFLKFRPLVSVLFINCSVPLVRQICKIICET